MKVSVGSAVHGCGCVDQVFTVRILGLAEKAREFNTPLYLCFVDLLKAYDPVNQQALYGPFCGGMSHDNLSRVKK